MKVSEEELPKVPRTEDEEEVVENEEIVNEEIIEDAEEVQESEEQEKTNEETISDEKEETSSEAEELVVEKAEEVVSEVKVEEIDDLDEVIIEEDNIMENSDKKSHKKAIIISIISVILVLSALILSTVFALLNVNNNGMIAGIKVKDIEVQGLNKEEAVQKITEALTKELEKEVKIKIDENEYSIVPSQIQSKYNVEAVTEEAFVIGRNGNIFVNNFAIVKSMILGNNLDVNLEYNDKLLNAMVNDLAIKMPGAVEEFKYSIDDDKLIITKGKAGKSIDKESLKQAILEKIKNNDSENIVIATINAEPQTIDIDKIHAEVFKEPKNAYYNKDPYEVFKHVDGVDFDVEKAKEILKENKEEYEIPLTITPPETTVDEIGTEAFPNRLSKFSTRYNSAQTDRTTNLRLAANKLDEVVVMPGETFSYNKTLGQRTVESGYKEAAGYIGGRVVPTLGGGICQISSTLYDAVVMANLDIVERENHMFLTSYVGEGKDATVAYGSIDFRFKNTRKYPIIIKSTVSNGIATIEIFGVKEEKEYEIELQSQRVYSTAWKTIYETDKSLKPGTEKVVQGAMNGCKSVTYKVYKLNGVEVSRELLSTDIYDPMNRIIHKGPAVSKKPTTTKPVTEKPETEKPATENPTTEKPTTETPTQENPTPENPETESPTGETNP